MFIRTVIKIKINIPATIAYAIPWGISVKLTVKPARRSCMKKEKLYAGNHWMMGNFFLTMSIVPGLIIALGGLSPSAQFK